MCAIARHRATFVFLFVVVVVVVVVFLAVSISTTPSCSLVFCLFLLLSPEGQRRLERGRDGVPEECGEGDVEQQQGRRAAVLPEMLELSLVNESNGREQHVSVNPSIPAVKVECE